MVLESIALGTITLTYKPPPVEVGYQVPQISLMEPIEVAELVPLEPVRPMPTANTYEVNQCTWWVKEWKPEVSSKWGNANTWGVRAALDGWTVSDTPIVGAVAWSDRGRWGHVAYVLEVNGDSVLIREGNYDYRGSVRTITVPTSKYLYIY